MINFECQFLSSYKYFNKTFYYCNDSNSNDENCTECKKGFRYCCEDMRKFLEGEVYIKCYSHDDSNNALKLCSHFNINWASGCPALEIDYYNSKPIYYRLSMSFKKNEKVLVREMEDIEGDAFIIFTDDIFLKWMEGLK